MLELALMYIYYIYMRSSPVFPFKGPIRQNPMNVPLISAIRCHSYRDYVTMNANEEREREEREREKREREREREIKRERDTGGRRREEE